MMSPNPVPALILFPLPETQVSLNHPKADPSVSHFSTVEDLS